MYVADHGRGAVEDIAQLAGVVAEVVQANGKEGVFVDDDRDIRGEFWLAITCQRLAFA